MPLVHYTKWKKGRKCGPNSLILDPENYRLEKRPGEALSEKQIIEQMVQTEGVKDLAAEIVAKGYMPVEDIIIIEEGGKKIVVEGNRRVCAFKLLSRPARSPKSALRTFQKLKEKAGDELPSQIYFVVAPNRTEANVYIYSKHADEGFSKRWLSIRQAAFVAGQLKEGASVTDVCSQTGMSKSQILQELAALDLYRLAGIINLSDRARSLMTNPKTFPHTALVGRIFGSPKIRELLGVELTEGGLRGKLGSRDGFLKVIEQIFEDLAEEGDGDEAVTRKYGTNEKAVSRIQSLKYSPEGAANWPVFNPSDIALSKSANNDLEENRIPQKQRTSSKTKAIVDYLLPLDLQVEVGTAKLASLIAEAQRIDVGQYYHSAAVFLRCIFEMALNNAVALRKCKTAILSAHAKKTFRGEVGVGILLEEIKPGGLLDLKLSEDEQRGVKHLAADGRFSFDQFPLFVHNAHWPASAPELIALREKILPILRKALLQPETKR